MFRFCVHYGIHFLVPMAIGIFFFKENKVRNTLILVGGILIDVDHLWAVPMFDADRCSILFHPLHSYWAITAYVLLLFPKKTRIFGIALLIHILADTADCLLM